MEIVPTPWGPIAVTVAGDRSKTPLLTYHDVGVNHQSCFQQLMSASSNRSLLVKNFCFYHIDAPGCEVRQQPPADDVSQWHVLGALITRQ